MPKLENQGRLKKFAIHKFDAGIQEGFAHTGFTRDLNISPAINEDTDIKIKQNTKKFTFHTKRVPEKDIIIGNIDQDKEWLRSITDRNDPEDKPLSCQTSSRSSQKTKQKDRNLIQLGNKQIQMSEKNINIQRKIDKLRNAKLKYLGEKNRLLFFSTIQEKTPLKIQMSAGKNELTQRKGKNKIFTPKKVQKQQNKLNFKKYNSHYIDMEIAVEPETYFLQDDKMQNTIKKQNLNYNIMERIKQRKMNQLMNSKNIYYAEFQTPVHLLTDEEKKLIWESKLQNFMKMKASLKVKITLNQLKEFRQIVYRKRLQEQLAFQEEQRRQLLRSKKKQITQMSNKPSGSRKLVKKQQVNIQNQKNYLQLLEGTDEEFEKFQRNMKLRNRRKLFVSFDQNVRLPRKAANMSASTFRKY